MLYHQNWVTLARIEGQHNRSMGTNWSWSCSPFLKPYCCFLVAVIRVWGVWQNADQIANEKPSMRITWIMSLRKWIYVGTVRKFSSFSLKKRNNGPWKWNFKIFHFRHRRTHAHTERRPDTQQQGNISFGVFGQVYRVYRIYRVYRNPHTVIISIAPTKNVRTGHRTEHRLKVGRSEVKSSSLLWSLHNHSNILHTLLHKSFWHRVKLKESSIISVSALLQWRFGLAIVIFMTFWCCLAVNNNLLNDFKFSIRDPVNIHN